MHPETPGGGRLERSRGRLRLVLPIATAVVAVLGVAAVVLLRDDVREPGVPNEVSLGIERPQKTSLRTVFMGPRGAAPTPRRPGAPGRVGAGAPGAGEAEHVPGRLIVKFEEGTPPAVARDVLADVEADVEARVDPLDVRVVEVAPAETRDALKEVAASPAVEYVERDVAVHGFATTPNDALWEQQWGLLLVDAPDAWDVATGSASVVVAVLDTGVDGSHPDLRSSLVAGYDFVNGDSDPADDHGHGTAAAGVIAARTNNGVGQAGICWHCSLMPVKVLDAGGSGAMSGVAAGIVWAVDHGARVISMSLGGEQPTKTLAEAVDYALGKGAVLVAAAGNSGTATPSYPAAYDGVIGVAATTQADELYSWSNFGSWVQVAAPGCNVAPQPSGEYVNFCGTSSATPVVAGIAGLALSASPGAGRAQVEQALTRSATELGGGVRHGRVSAARAIGALGVQRQVSPPAPAATPPGASVPATTRAPAPTVTRPSGSTVRGRLAATGTLRLPARYLPAGRITATLAAPGSRSLTLTLLDARGRAVGRVAGRGSLRLSRTVAAGRYRFVVRGTGRVAFTLKVARG